MNDNIIAAKSYVLSRAHPVQGTSLRTSLVRSGQPEVQPVKGDDTALFLR